ncbi:MAG: SDR family oxidoreductase [Nocardioidaceae bacterium]|nr:SDR family oxidoreductase [Nocardioidaceae bacterium]
MLLENKNAVVYGAAGSMGAAVARAFAREGARLFLAGRTLATLDAVAEKISAAGGVAQTAEVDALDQQAVEHHADEVASVVGSIDISFNGISVTAVQGTPLVDMSLEDFMAPVVESARTHFVTATAAARRMTAQGSGVVVMLSSSAARESRHRMGGFNLACASIEAFTRSLAGEVGRDGVRVVCLRPNFTPETVPEVSESDLQPLVDDTLLGRLPRLAEVADTALFLASDGAGAITGAVVNLTCGAIVD